MQWVDIIESNMVAMTAKISARASVADGGAATLEGDEDLCAVLGKGVLSHEHGTRVTPADGVAFLDALQLNFRTPYLYASDRQTGDAPAAPVGSVAPIVMQKPE